jgi:hypothetical protein
MLNNCFKPNPFLTEFNLFEYNHDYNYSVSIYSSIAALFVTIATYAIDIFLYKHCSHNSFIERASITHSAAKYSAKVSNIY